MANEGKFRRLQCEQACEEKVASAKSFALAPMEYIIDFYNEVASIVGGTSKEQLEIVLDDSPATMQQLQDAFDNEEFDAIVVTYNDGMSKDVTFSTLGAINGMSIDIDVNKIDIEIDSRYLTNVDTNSGVEMAGYITGVYFNNNKATVSVDGLIADTDNGVVSLRQKADTFTPTSIRVSFYKLVKEQ